MKVTAPVRIDISGGWPDSDPYRREYGGTVLNAAIDLRISAKFEGHNLITSLEQVPEASGLGTSGALRAAYICASNLDFLNREGDFKYELIRKVHGFENEVLEQRAGFQDQAAAIFGGVNVWFFMPSGAITHVPVERERAQHLQDRLTIVYTGESHLSANIHELVFGEGNYERNIPTLNRMQELCRNMHSYMTEEKIMARLINETWDLQRGLHDSIETDRMRSLQKQLEGKYLACRATGAGGGGCMIFYHHPDVVIDVPGKIPFKFDYEGIRAEE